MEDGGLKDTLVTIITHPLSLEGKETAHLKNKVCTETVPFIEGSAVRAQFSSGSWHH